MVLGFSAAASAQSPARSLVRADVSATIGWLDVDASPGSDRRFAYNQWASSLFGPDYGKG